MLYRSLFFSAFWACSQTPTVDDSSYKTAKVVHARFSLDCQSCHEDKRPTTDDEIVHGGDKDCSLCHIALDPPYKDSDIHWARLVFSHTPKPQTCGECHSLKRSTSEDHPKTGDCAQCHNYPKW